MKDIFTGYHRKKVLSHISVLGLSIFCALGINALIFSSPEGQKMSANIMGINTSQEISSEELSGIKAEITNTNTLRFVTQQDLAQVQNMTLSLAYDPDIIQIQTPDDPNIVFLNEEAGIASLIYTLPEYTDFDALQRIFEIPFTKIQDSPTLINIFGAGYADHTSENNYLSTRPISL